MPVQVQTKMEPKRLVEIVLSERAQNGHVEEEFTRALSGFEYAENLLRELRESHFAPKKAKKKA